jgi:hypothetical protein
VVAGLFLAAFVAFLLVLAAQSRINQRQPSLLEAMSGDALYSETHGAYGSSENHGAYGAIATGDTDPLGLAQAGLGFELIGVAPGGSVIGYSCGWQRGEATQLVTNFLLSQGWYRLDGDMFAGNLEDAGLGGGNLEDADGQGALGEQAGVPLSFSYPSASGASAFLLVQCVSIPTGSSVIVEVL